MSRKSVPLNRFLYYNNIIPHTAVKINSWSPRNWASESQFWRVNTYMENVGRVAKIWKPVVYIMETLEANDRTGKIWVCSGESFT